MKTAGRKMWNFLNATRRKKIKKIKIPIVTWTNMEFNPLNLMLHTSRPGKRKKWNPKFKRLPTKKIITIIESPLLKKCITIKCGTKLSQI